jgi:hypothetical protein
LKGIDIEALLVDIDEKAFIRAHELLKEYDLLNEIKTEKNDVNNVDKISERFNPDIIEMMGFLDYINQEKAIELAKKALSSLSNGGYMITCNIQSNLERYFLTWVIDWPMVYRTPEELGGIAKEAGFRDYRLVYEPLKIHGILIAKK